MTLLIDTTDRYRLKVGLRHETQMVAEVEVEVEVASKADQQLLPLIDQLLSDYQATANINQIEVAPGPGSFTGTRVGVAVANALSLAWGVPINGLTESFVEPIYASQPHITRKK